MDGANQPISDLYYALDMAIEALEQTEQSNSENPNNCDTCKHNKLEWFSEVCDGCSKAHSNYEPKDEPKTQMKTQNSNKNSNTISVYDGVSEAVRCAMCSNPNKSDRGCDGACSYDEKLYERIMKAIAESIADIPQTVSLTSAHISGDIYHKWETPPKFEHKGDITTCVSVPASLLEIEDEPQTDCPWK